MWEIFIRVGWVDFLAKFQGYDTVIYLEFSQTFNVAQALIRQITFIVNEDTLIQVIRFLQQGETWSNNFKFLNDNGYPFLEKPFPHIYLKHGIK